MRRRPERSVRHWSQHRQRNGMVRARAVHGVPFDKRTRGARRDPALPFLPPEDWYEPDENQEGYELIVQPAGFGFSHILTPEQVQSRLAQLPERFLKPLKTVQFSRMTRKKRSFPCYGLQWGSTLYLYPLEMDLVERYHRPPRPSQRIEAQMYGGRWVQESERDWKLVWTREAIEDFYLNNILIHELGHLLDDRNSRPVDRERYAEWFATEYGYKPTMHQRRARLRAQGFPCR